MRLLWHSGLLYLCFQVTVSCLADDKIFPEAMRTWTDVDGREIRAVLRGVIGDKVTLVKGGKEYFFPLFRLSEPDQSYVRDWVVKHPETESEKADDGKPPPLTDLELKAAPDVNIQLVELTVLLLTNEIRKSYGINSLLGNEEISTIARTHSKDMGVRGFFSHNNPDGDDPTARARKAGFSGLIRSPDGKSRPGLSENIGRVGRYASFQEMKRDGKMIRRRIRWHTETTMARQIVLGFMASVPHRANLLDPSKAYLGVGVHVHREHVFATQNFF
jgi:uncharacterized protein YkwD